MYELLGNFNEFGIFFYCSFDPYNSRQDGGHGNSGNPMFRNQQSSFGESSNMNMPMDTGSQYGGSQSQLELANQILKAVLSSTVRIFFLYCILVC